LVGWINRHPSGKGGAYTVLHVVQTGIEVAWDGTAIRSLPKNWRDKVEFEAACGPASVRKNITQPADWWAAFEATAKEAGLSLSEWAGECMLTRVPKPLRDTLSKRPGAHRPRREETNAE
jgi:hypothetical protein